jgi:hypothetical protein
MARAIGFSRRTVFDAPEENVPEQAINVLVLI